METSRSYRTGYRMTLGPNRINVGWVNTAPNVDLASEMKTISFDYSAELKKLMDGEIEEIDYDANIKKFHIADADGEFLGYVDAAHPTSPEIMQKLWNQITFTSYS